MLVVILIYLVQYREQPLAIVKAVMMLKTPQKAEKVMTIRFLKRTAHNGVISVYGTEGVSACSISCIFIRYSMTTFSCRDNIVLNGTMIMNYLKMCTKATMKYL